MVHEILWCSVSRRAAPDIPAVPEHAGALSGAGSELNGHGHEGRKAQ